MNEDKNAFDFRLGVPAIVVGAAAALDKFNPELVLVFNILVAISWHRTFREMVPKFVRWVLYEKIGVERP